MIDTRSFGEQLKQSGFQFFTGVPCSFLKDLINYAINDCEYVGAANEGDAVAIASGAQLGGQKAVVLMQNSGLTNAVSPLTSLNYTFKLPVLGFVSLRGEPGVADEPQHELMGTITTKLLDFMQVKWAYLSDIHDEAVQQLQQADEYIRSKQTFFFVVKKGTFGKVALDEQPNSVQKPYAHVESAPLPRPTVLPSRYEMLQTVNAAKHKHTIQLATTGLTGRELFEIEDAPQNLYMVGSMGCISSLALGLSLVQSGKKIIAIDGDGALLMRMGNLATVGHYGRQNLLHLVLDNGCHDSTGGQNTVSTSIDLAAVAAACRYAKVIVVDRAEQLAQAIVQWHKQPQLTFIHAFISRAATGSVGRPTMKPYQVKERLMEYMER
ncbi:phosphonopyruvate decarboxylase [Paenibacillus campi]|uniref:phosphonopyruvate decarboxylase n=1 Tax=Paenibacillus campi TaxID=3106031 RepID=UPI002AFE9A1F|nr:phosphonopyruvate decarboxylase [Paenibacillus sp. SGZ-1009]